MNSSYSSLVWIGFCRTGPISLYTDSFVFICLYSVFFRTAYLLYDCERGGVHPGAQPHFQSQAGRAARGREGEMVCCCLLYTSPSPRDRQKSRMPSSA